VIQAEEIKQCIESNLPNSIAIIEGDDGVHFDAVVISIEFTDKSLVKRQQLVYSALGDWITSGKLHALALRTLTPAQWNEEQ